MFDPQYMQSQPVGEFIGILVALIAVVAVCLYFFVRFLRTARLIHDTPTSKIRSAAQGFVELEGMADEIKSTIEAPLTGRECVWYRFNIQRKEKSGKNTTWRTIQSGEHPGPILIRDTTGECFINLHRASIYPAIKTSWYGMSRYPSKLSVERMDSLLQFGDYRYQEEIISKNSPLYAMGGFKTVRQIDQHEHSSVVKNIISDWKQDYQSLLTKFDKNGDGTLDEKEWKLVRLAAQLEAEDIRKAMLAEPDLHTLEKQGSYPLIVAADDQKGLARRFFWYALAGFLGFLGSTYVLAEYLMASGSGSA